MRVVTIALVFTLIAAADPWDRRAAAWLQAAMSREVAAATAEETKRLVRQRYVFPEKADAVIERIDQGLASGRYTGGDPQQLAARLTEDLQAVTNDKHMSVKFNPSQAAGLLASRAGRGNQPDADAYYAKLMATSNYGVPEMKVLPGNVRYVKLAPGFFWHPTRSPQAYDDAMRFLGRGDAYILDIRDNGGGSPAAVRYVISHFMEPGRKLMTFRMGPQGTSESRTQEVTVGRLPDRPLYVLIGPKSASATEEFASHIRNFELGTLVGATTAGAGHRNELFGTAGGFVISISVGTALHAVTNEGWEGTGVTPDIAVPVDSALDAAHRDALKRMKSESLDEREHPVGSRSIRGGLADG